MSNLLRQNVAIVQVVDQIVRQSNICIHASKNHCFWLDGKVSLDHVLDIIQLSAGEKAVGVQLRNRTSTNRERVGEWVRDGAPVRSWCPLFRAGARRSAVACSGPGVLEYGGTGALEYGARGAPLRARPLSYRPPAGLPWFKSGST